MHYIVYQTTNLIDGKIYIGQHQTSDLNDGYLGSGKHLQRAINKYGVENFQREILYQFDNLEDMSSKEAELVTEEFCNREDTYNICPGGKGGFGYINSNGLKHKQSFTDNDRKKAVEKSFFLRSFDLEWSLKRKKNLEKVRFKPNHTIWKGRKHSDESKRKMSLSKQDKYRGSLNSQFGSMWITNGTENRKIKKLDQIPEGWYKGRVNCN